MAFRAISAVAAIVLLASVVALHAAHRDVEHRSVPLANGESAIVYEPDRASPASPLAGARLPVVVLAHGFGGSARVVGSLARQLARHGFAVVTFDFRGHGESVRAFVHAPGAARTDLIDDLDAALLYARGVAHFDPERVAIAGYGMGAEVALELASRDPGVGATIAISGARAWTGGYAPTNVLFLWSDGDSPATERRARDLTATLAGTQQIVLDRFYGDASRGTATKAIELARESRIGILHSAQAGEVVATWLGRTIGPGPAPREGTKTDATFGWSALGLAAAATLFAFSLGALAPLVPAPCGPSAQSHTDTSPRIVWILPLLLALAAGALFAAGGDAVALRGPFSFVPLVAGRALVGFLAISGALFAFTLAGRGAPLSRGLAHRPSWIGALTLFAASYGIIGTLAEPFAHLWLSPDRALAAGLCALLVLPFFGAVEGRLRSSTGSGIWLPALAKLLALFAIGIAAAFDILPRALLDVAPIAFTLFVAFELAALALYRALGHPWPAAIFQSALTAWLVAATFPYDG